MDATTNQLTEPSPEQEPAPATAPPPARPQGVLKLRTDLRFVPQHSAEKWECVIEDPVAKQFYRIGREDYLVASSLDGNHDIAEIVDILAAHYPEASVDAESTERSIKWFMSTGLASIVQSKQAAKLEDDDAIESTNPNSPNPNPAAPPPKRDSFNIPVDPFSFKFHLMGGEKIEWLARKLHWLCSVPALIAGVFVILTAAVTFLSNPSVFTELGSKLFVPEAALWWAGAWFMLKFAHELGHATFCVAEGARVRGAGLAFFYLAPMPYVDTTDMWRLPTSKSRALCAAGGMWFELLLSCGALIVCNSFENPTWQYFCIALATLGTFTTVAFNANPFVRFDGYFILSDMMNRPTLWVEGQNAWKSIFSGRMMFISTALSLHGLPLVLYGGGCFLNRMFMMIGLAWGTWHAWHGIGLVMIAFACYLWFINPYIKRQYQLAAVGQPAFQIPSFRKVITAATCLVAIAVVSYFVPSPWQPLVPGILSYGDPTVVRPAGDGVIARVLIEDNQYIDAGTSLVEIENPSLELNRATVALQLESSRERCRVLRAQNKIAEMQAEQAKVDSLQEQSAQLEIQSAQMIIKAPIQGRFISRQLSRQVGQFMRAGQALGMIVPSKEVEVSCTVSQEDIEQYRSSIGDPVIIHLEGVGQVLGEIREVEPRGLDTLESPILAAKHGGPIAVHYISKETDNKDPMRTNKPRFIAKVVIDPTSLSAATMKPLVAGQLCRVELIESQITLANAINRWVDAFIKWVKPPQIDMPA
ncbi:MAG: HlyD family efflux transporter periplasmic adaptor subunit [Planctomycetota bacterium]|nr:HlyD family efflux transporter periplasmic adaptor subunit [Planctomycetota bacterium]